MLLLLSIIALIVIKLSLLGMGMTTITAAMAGWLVCRIRLGKITSQIRRKFHRLFLTAIGLHLLVYISMLIKLFMLSSFSQLPEFILAHLVLHHIISAVISAILVFMAINIYNCQRRLTTTPADNPKKQITSLLK